MKQIDSQIMKRLNRPDPRLFAALGLMALGLLAACLSPALKELGGEGVGDSLAFYLPRILVAAGFMALFFYIRRVSDRMARFRDLGDDRLIQAQRELESGGKAYGPQKRVWLTKHFLISGDYQLEVVPFDQIQKVYRIGELLAVLTKDQRAHVIVSKVPKKDWTQAFEEELHLQIRQAGTAPAGPEKGEAERGEEPAAAKKAPGTAPRTVTLPPPSRGAALAGGLLLAVPATAVWALFTGFALWGPLLGGMAMFFLVSMGCGFGAKNLFVRRKDLSQWRPENRWQMAGAVSLAVTAADGVVYHGLLLTSGYGKGAYGLSYALGHLPGLLKEHGLWGLFQSRMGLSLLMILILTLHFGLRAKRAGVREESQGGNRAARRRQGKK